MAGSLNFQPLEALPPAALFGSMLLGLLHCFLGYPLLRLLLMAVAACMGVALGCHIVSLASAQPRGLDYLVACGSATIVLVLASWFLYRIVLALLVAGGTGFAVVQLLGSSTGALIAAGVAGLVLAALLFVYLRPIVIALTAIGGAAQTVLLGAALIDPPLADPQFIAQQPLALGLAIGCGVLLAVGGAWTQRRMVRLWGGALAPKHKPKPAAPKLPALQKTPPAGR